MRQVLFLLFFLSGLLLAGLLPPAQAAAVEQACAIPVQPSGNYYCLSESSYSSTTPSFETFCRQQGGSVVSASSSSCQQVCCCDQSQTPEVAFWSEPVSKAFCTNQPNFATHPPQADCTAGCGGTGGGTGTHGGSYTVSGVVYDDQDPTSSARLADARIQFPAGSQIVTAFSNGQGAFTLYDVPQGTVNFKASKYGCGEQEQSVDITGDKTGLDFHLDCSIGECQVDAVDDTTAVPVPSKDKVRVTWTVSDCPNIETYEVERCTGLVSADHCQQVGFTSDGTFIDTGVPAGQQLCYAVTAITSGGTEVSQSADVTENCVKPMNQHCLDGGAQQSTCFFQDTSLQPLDTAGQQINPFTGAAHCTPDNQVALDEDCGADGKVCYDTSQGTTGCRLPSDCDQCNGLYGWLVDLSAKVTGGDTCAQLAGCVLDNHGYAEDTFAPCAGVTSCYDYRSQAACASGTTTDQCHVSRQGCRWVTPPGLDALGKGVCVPKDATEGADCEACSSIFSFCNETLCGDLGSTCYWNTAVQEDGVEPLLPQGAAGACVSKQNMACAYYDAQADCNGGTDVTVDVTYNDSSLDAHRTDGTNAITTRSRDALGFGTCAWVGADNQCVKDANGLRLPNPSLDKVADDCLEHPLAQGASLSACFRDNEPPNTTLPFAPDSYIDAQLLRSVPPVVQDNVYTLDPRTATRFCLVKRGESCYPNETFDTLLPGTIGAAPYTLYYYSVDPANNLEPVKHINLNIDRDNSIFLVSARLIS